MLMHNGRKLNCKIGTAPLVFRAALDGVTGYGKSALDIIRALRGAGVALDVRGGQVWEPWGFHLPPDIRGLLVDESTAPQELLLACPQVPGLYGKRTIHYTMWESSYLPPDVVANLNRAERLIVPCEWNRVCFRACGVTAPIDIIPLWLEVPAYSPAPMAMDGPTVFGCGGRTAHGGVRKGIAECVQTFLEAFPSEPDVRLSVKIFQDCDPAIVSPDPRVEIIREAWSSQQMAEWYRSLTAYVTMALAEGFGLMPLQALACGRPVVGTLAHGHLEYLDAANSYPVEHREEDCSETLPSQRFYSGTWYRPERESAVAQLRRVHADREAARQKGAAGARRALDFQASRWEGSLLELLAA